MSGEREVIIVGNYLTDYGEPVLATQMPPVLGETPIGGYIVAVGWTCRWIKSLAPEVEPVYTEGKLRLEHGGRRFDVRPGNWIVWDGGHFKNVPPGYFNSRYTAVNFASTVDGGERG